MIRLKEHNASFATRQRARELVEEATGSRTVVVDFDDVVCSPSFIAELLVGLGEFAEVVAVATNATLESRLKHMTEQLGLAEHVKVEPLVPA